METVDLRPFVESVKATLATHEAGGVGAYRRWLTQNEKGTRDLGATVYGCADAAHILYTIGAMPAGQEERAAWVTRLQSYQEPDTSRFVSADHHWLHTTAFCAGALELFDARPVHVLSCLEPYTTRQGLWDLLEGLDWVKSPWAESHRGAGIYGAMVLAGPMPLDWEDWYFEWLWENQDAETGLWRRGCVRGVEGGAPPFHHLASSFHYLFNADHARRPLRHAEALVDTCLAMHRDGALPAMGRGLSWNEIDFLYTLRSLQKRTSHRAEESRALVRQIAARLVASVQALDPVSDPGMNDLHTLFAGLCSLAVAQEAVPGLIRTAKPLRLVLDRRPFL